jgi:hypothetical protein
MQKRTWVLSLAAVCGLLVACGGGDDGGGGGAGGQGGSSGMTSGSGSGGTGGGGGSSGMGGSGELCTNSGDENLDCPPFPPQTGACAPKGACCHRSSNIAKEAELGPDETGVLEYRIQYSLTENHDTTIGIDALNNLGIMRYDTEQQSLLWRFEGPRAGGEEISGMGKSTIGIGRYNCDGTYSFYSDSAAPVVEGVSDDVTRWAAEEVPSVIDVEKTGRERSQVPFAMNANRDLTFTPFVVAETYALDWELVNQGFDILTIDTTGDGRDCIGSRGPDGWIKGGDYEVYTPLAGNNLSTITAISQKYCQLVAFGIIGAELQDRNCETEPRCMPGTADCIWKKLPDSLCPITAAEKEFWGCHLGDPANVNAEPDYPTDVACTDAAPTSVLDPMAGATSKGQCCDPMGTSTTLPACNAYRLVQSYTAAAAEITDERADTLQPKCM